MFSNFHFGGGTGFTSHDSLDLIGDCMVYAEIEGQPIKKQLLTGPSHMVQFQAFQLMQQIAKLPKPARIAIVLPTHRPDGKDKMNNWVQFMNNQWADKKGAEWMDL